jgi:radical SAM superfamily enzyme YgiQ (UPF0313 family)
MVLNLNGAYRVAPQSTKINAMKRNVTFASLKHTNHSCNAIALGLATVVTYAKIMVGDRMEAHLFQLPEDLALAWEKNNPQMVCFSNYCWNFNLSCEFARRVKKISPKTITVFGGPNYPLELDEQKEFLLEHPEIDFYIFRDGELPFVELFKGLDSYDFDFNRLKNDRVVFPQTHYIHQGEMVYGELIPLLTDLDEIPSPYLTGLCDNLLSGDFVPIIQTKKGCPFKCTFCEDGNDYHNRIRRFSYERVSEELDYIAQRTQAPHLLFADLNFGMYQEDLEVARALARIQEKYDWPQFFGSLGGKNNKKRVIEAATIIHNPWFSAAIQTTDEAVLQNIKRNNISKSEMMGFIQEGEHLGASNSSELILGLPGDTLQKHFQSNFEMIDVGIQTVRTHQTMMLPGAEMASKKDREKFGLVSRFRVNPNTSAPYNVFGENFFASEVDEICVASDSMPFEDYLECRLFNLTVEIFYNGGLFDELLKFLKRYDIRISTFIKNIHDKAKKLGSSLFHIYEHFLQESQELWESKAEVDEFLCQTGVIEKYRNGELGNNEQLMYRAIAIIEHMDDAHHIAFNEARKLLEEKGVLESWSKDYLSELETYSSLRKRDILSFEKVEKRWFRFDFIGLSSRDFDEDPSAYYNPEGRLIQIAHSQSQKKVLKQYIKIYGASRYGFGNLLSQSHVSKHYRKVIAI